MLTFKLLGEATISLDGDPLTGIGSRTAEALLIYLACEKRPFSRQHLAEFFWEERDPAQSAANLRAALSLLRKQVGDYLLVTRQTVAFNADLPHSIDVLEFESRLAEGQLSIDNCQLTIVNYAGPFLDGFYLRESRAFEEWSLLRREQLQQQAILLLRDLLADPAISQDIPSALEYADRLLRLNPFSEYAHQQKMLLLARSGQLQAALMQYQQCQALLLDELGVEPAPETAVLANRIRRASQSPRHNLPLTPTPFVGRAQELADLQAQLIDPEFRLLTIIGPGGAGKTRLALEAARRLTHTGYFLSGLRFAPLANVETPDLIPGLIATELGLTFQGNAPAAAQLAAALADEELLLILDNLEHLLEGESAEETADLLAQLLAAAPHLTLLVTSRQRLRLHEEWLFDVDGLALPEAGAAEADAVQLFLQTARRARRNFQPDAAELAAIRTICRLLAGLPLAIELAAAWLRQMSCAEIAARLAENGSDLLTSSLRNIPERHRSITAVFDHSWALLTDQERAIFARLALFRGRFTVAAATAVAWADRAILHSLLDKSLLRLVAGGGGPAGYDIHPLLRQLAADRLAADPPIAQETRAAHGRYFAQLAAEGEARLHGPEEPKQLEALRLLLPDLRAAWQWAAWQWAGQQVSDLLARMLYSLAYLYDVQALYREGADLLQTAVAHLETELNRGGAEDAGEISALSASPRFITALRGRLLSWRGRFLTHLGQYGAARESLETAVGLLRPLDQPADLALALTFLGELARFEADFAAARSHQAESLALAQAAGADDVAALALLHTGKIEIAEGEYRAARQVCAEGLALAQRQGAPRQIAIFLDNLGTVALELGDYTEARQKFGAGYELRLTLRDRWGTAVSLNNLGVLALITGDYAAAADNSRQAGAAFRQIGHRWGEAMALTNLGRAQAYQGTLAAAQESLNQALRLWREVGGGLEEGDAWLYLGQIALQRGDAAAAQTALEQSLALFTAFEDERQMALVWRELGVALTWQGELAEGGRYLRRSLLFAARQAVAQDVVYALAGWAVWYERKGETAVARQLLALAAEHPAAWRHEQEEATRQLAALGGPVAGERMGVETAVALCLA
jgi:predicted ATPase/DNA-binding SARP family transcriptional activator